MPSINVVDMKGKKVSTIDLADSVFAVEPNQAVMHQMVVSYLANQRQGTQSTLTRSEVSGGGKKPWRQKGTGRARQGSTRAPQWTHGGVVFAPKPRDYSFSVNKKVKRLAMKSALSSKVAENEVIVVDAITTDEFKTKVMVEMLNAIGVEKKALIVLPEVDKKVIKSASNIKGVKTAQVNELNVYDILNAGKLVIAKDAVSKIEEVYA
jgi:large subunit ribosomal protein L4